MPHSSPEAGHTSFALIQPSNTTSSRKATDRLHLQHVLSLHHVRLPETRAKPRQCVLCCAVTRCVSARASAAACNEFAPGLFSTSTGHMGGVPAQQDAGSAKLVPHTAAPRSLCGSFDAASGISGAPDPPTFPPDVPPVPQSASRDQSATRVESSVPGAVPESAADESAAPAACDTAPLGAESGIGVQSACSWAESAGGPAGHACIIEGCPWWCELFADGCERYTAMDQRARSGGSGLAAAAGLASSRAVTPTGLEASRAGAHFHFIIPAMSNHVTVLRPGARRSISCPGSPNFHAWNVLHL